MKKDLSSIGNDFPELDVKTIHGELNSPTITDLLVRPI